MYIIIIAAIVFLLLGFYIGKTYFEIKLSGRIEYVWDFMSRKKVPKDFYNGALFVRSAIEALIK